MLWFNQGFEKKQLSIPKNQLIHIFASHSVYIQITFHLIKCQLHRSNLVKHHPGAHSTVTHCYILFDYGYIFFCYLSYCLDDSVFFTQFFIIKYKFSFDIFIKWDIYWYEQQAAHAYIDIIVNISIFCVPANFKSISFVCDSLFLVQDSFIDSTPMAR